MLGSMAAKSDAAKPDDEPPASVFVFWYCFLCTNSIGMVIVNKYLMHQVSAPWLLLLWQNSATVVLTYLLATTNVFQFKRMTKDQFLVYTVPAITFTFMLATSLKALPLIAVATVVVFRNISTVIVSIGELIFFKKKLSRNGNIGLGIMLCGAMIYAHEDVSFNPEGYFWISLNTVIFSFQQLYEKYAVSNMDQTSAGISVIKNLISLPVLVIVAFVMGDFNASTMAELSSSSTLFHLLWTFTGALGCGLSLSYMSLYKISPATSITVGGNVNKLLSIIVGYLVFHKSLSYSQGFGVLVCMGGALFFSLKK